MSEQKSLSEIREHRAGTYKKLIRYGWILFGLGILAAIGIFVGLSFTDLPDTAELENPKKQLASEVFASDGSVLGRYFIENRVEVSFDELSPNIEQALVATEDERYYNHAGIDAEALGRMLVKTGLMGNKSSGGASTITQQLARQLFTKYTKQEIMAMYLNKVDFLNDGDGIHSAAEIYFGKSQADLNVQEAAMLMGMLKNPAYFNPVRRPEKVTNRRMVVFKQMQKNDLLTQAEYDSLRVLPLGLSFERKSHADGLAPYFRMELRKELSRILKNERKPDGSEYNIYKDGLKVYTTIDPKIQAHAEAAMVEHMSKIQNTYWKHWKGMDPWTYEEYDEGIPKELAQKENDLRARERKLKLMIQGSNRYKKMRERYLAKPLKALLAEVDGLKGRDRDIERMLEEEEKKGSLTRLVSRKMISASMAADYRDAIKADAWPEVKKQWGRFQEVVQTSFEKPVKMRVFTYENEQFEKDTTMTPMDSLKYHHAFLQIGSMSVDPITGHVKSWVGGINHKYFQYDHIHTRRQVGSTIKPLIYATAISQLGMSPCQQVYDSPQTISPGEGSFYLEDPWTPKNAKGEYSGELLTLKDGLRQSKNTVSVYLMKQMRSVQPIIDLLTNMGVDTKAKYSNGDYIVPRVPSLCLGSCDLTVYEMTGAYTTFANNGLYNKPVFIDKIVTKDGQEIFRSIRKDLPALEESYNHIMVEMLRYAAGYMGFTTEGGGKTGTTNSHVDGWFMGITPKLVVGTWVGGEDRWIRFRTLDYGQGAFLAKPFFKKFAKRLEDDESLDVLSGKNRFYIPPGPPVVELDCSQYTTDQPAEGEETEDLNGGGDGFEEFFVYQHS